MNIIELILDEENNEIGIEAISVVENPAIEEDFIALNSNIIELAEVDKEKKLLVGALLIPNKPIYRKSEEEEYYIYFSKDTVVKASQMYLMNGNQSNATLEHEHDINGLTLVESWIVEDEVHDKSRKFGMNVPVGTWMGSVKVNNDEVWNDFVKTGKVKGFSIEGYFADRMERPKEGLKEYPHIMYNPKNGESITINTKEEHDKYTKKGWVHNKPSKYKEIIQEELSQIEEAEAEFMLSQIKAVIKNDKRLKKGKRTEMESFSDYPQSVSNNAKRGIELNKKVNNKCATQVGKVRAQQLADRKPISMETIKRMFSYLSRAEEYYKTGDTEACGYISYLLWGGKSAKSWAESKIKQGEKK